MNETPIGSLRLSTLSEHDRFVAEAQMARAEAIADAFLALSRWIRKGWAGLRASVHAYNTRQWPHPQALR
jgi:hypothetical protein